MIFFSGLFVFCMADEIQIEKKHANGLHLTKKLRLPGHYIFVGLNVPQNTCTKSFA